MLAACALAFTYLLFIQGNDLRLEPDFRQSPLANLTVNTFRLGFPDKLDFLCFLECDGYAILV